MMAISAKILETWSGAASLVNVLRSHHIIFVRYRSSGYGVAGTLVATTPPEVRQRFSTCDPAVATTNCASSSAIAENGVRAKVLPSDRLRFGSSVIHAVFIST